MTSNGKHYGIQPFFVQIRDWNTHEALPGIEVGDIGPKMGYAGKDNGFLRLTNFRAPKISLLGKYVTQNADGTVSIHGDSKALYSSMMFIRTGIAGSAYYNLMKSVIIGIRYSI